MPSIPQDHPCPKCGTAARYDTGACVECHRLRCRQRYERGAEERAVSDSRYARLRFNRASSTHKICDHCFECKPLGEYGKGSGANSTRNRCKECRRDTESGIVVRRQLARDVCAAGEKVCSGCGETKPFDEFWNDPRTGTGKVSRCKLCMGSEKKIRLDVGRSVRNAINRHRRRTDPEFLRRERESQRRSRLRHAQKLRDLANARYALKHGAGRADQFSRLDIWERDGGRCHICGKKCDPKDWHLDHLVPLSRGGDHTRRNVAVAHPFCNISRSNRGPAQLRLLG